jgi:predicted metal-binding membrane protein
MIAAWYLASLRHDRAVVLAGLGFVVVLAWAYLLLDAGISIPGVGTNMPGMDMGGGPMSARAMAMPTHWTLGYGITAFVMWAVMMVAMMLPSAAPVTLLIAALARRRAGSGGRVGLTTALFVAGYLGVWIGFSAVATLLQWRLDLAGALSAAMALASTAAAGAVLVAAGVYQWTPLKQACLRHCRSPLDFLLFHWRDGTAGALASGARHGLFCFGCCWMLMALLFVGGIMNIVWIAGIALLVLIEKVLPGGGWTGRATGAVMAAWGAMTLISAV